MTETNATLRAAARGEPVFPPGRYGRRREPRPAPTRTRRVLLAAVALAVVLLGAGAAYLLAQQYGRGSAYDPTVVRYHDITDAQVVVEFTVVVPEGEVATCLVRARGADGDEVGSEQVQVDPPPGVDRPVVVHTLATSGRPVTGEVPRCWQDQ